MDPAVLSRLLTAESDRIEWKESARDAGEMLRAACALANDLGGSGQAGYLLLGVDNRGHAVGEDASDEAIQRIVNRLTSVKILPHPSFDVQAATHEGKGILLIRVEPYAVPPIVKVDGVAWVRVGNTTRRASEADLNRLQERRPENRLPFDLRPWPGAQLADLDLTLLRQQYAVERDSDDDGESFPPLERWLAQRELIRHTDSGWTPNPAALLVYGVDPQTFLPGAIVEFVRYAGTDLDAPIVSRKTVTGRLTDQLETLWAQLQAHVVDLPAPEEGIRTPYLPEYPLEALKELARNLIQHRLYEGTHAPARVTWLEDRVIFTNPGGLFGQANEGDFGTHTDYRNPIITRLLVELGYVERLGRGIRRVHNLLAKNGNPPLELEKDGYTTVTVLRRP